MLEWPNTKTKRGSPIFWGAMGPYPLASSGGFPWIAWVKLPAPCKGSGSERNRTPHDKNQGARIALAAKPSRENCPQAQTKQGLMKRPKQPGFWSWPEHFRRGGGGEGGGGGGPP